MAKKQTTKPKQHTNPSGRLHIDRRARLILSSPEAQEDDDDLLTTRQVAGWFGCSQQWLEIARGRTYGPPFTVLAPGMVRYQRLKLKAWLKDRECLSTRDSAVIRKRIRREETEAAS